MIGLIQRVSGSAVTIDGCVVASIGPGLLALVGMQQGDDESAAQRLAHRVLNYRLFSDAARKMNLSLLQITGELLLVPQFTLAADTAKGLRAGFSTAAAPEHARRLFEALILTTRAQLASVQTGVFGAHMQVSLTNDGPVTFWLES